MKLFDPPIREKDHTHRVWQKWYVILKSLFHQDHIADASTSHSVDSWATTNTALDALGTKINSVLTALEASEINKDA